MSCGVLEEDIGLNGGDLEDGRNGFGFEYRPVEGECELSSSGGVENGSDCREGDGGKAVVQFDKRRVETSGEFLEFDVVALSGDQRSQLVGVAG